MCICVCVCVCVCTCVPTVLSGFSLMLLHLSTCFNFQSIFTCYILGDPQHEPLKRLIFFLPTLKVGKLRSSMGKDFVKVTQQSWESSGFLHNMATYTTVPVAFLGVPYKPAKRRCFPAPSWAPRLVPRASSLVGCFKFQPSVPSSAAFFGLSFL